ncbi:MAG: hypothetical protein NZ108_10990 [Bacteroidia bacterium]|nr:hypothetical protein [Bacteroidia bacterium]
MLSLEQIPGIRQYWTHFWQSIKKIAGWGFLGTLAISILLFLKGSTVAVIVGVLILVIFPPLYLLLAIRFAISELVYHIIHKGKEQLLEFVVLKYINKLQESQSPLVNSAGKLVGKSQEIGQSFQNFVKNFPKAGFLFQKVLDLFFSQFNIPSAVQKSVIDGQNLTVQEFASSLTNTVSTMILPGVLSPSWLFIYAAIGIELILVLFGLLA